jgi:hypothetical protein
MTATPPSRIALPPRPAASDVFGSTASPGLSPSDASPSVPYPNRGMNSRSLRPSFSTAGGGRRKVSRATLRGLEDLDTDEDGGAKLPTLVPGIRPAYSTPLPVLPMVVLCIVSLVMCQLECSEYSSPLTCRPCYLSYCPLIYVHRFSCPWWKVRDSSSPRERTDALCRLLCPSGMGRG